MWGTELEAAHSAASRASFETFGGALSQQCRIAPRASRPFGRGTCALALAVAPELGSGRSTVFRFQMTGLALTSQRRPP